MTQDREMLVHQCPAVDHLLLPLQQQQVHPRAPAPQQVPAALQAQQQLLLLLHQEHLACHAQLHHLQLQTCHALRLTACGHLAARQVHLQLVLQQQCSPQLAAHPAAAASCGPCQTQIGQLLLQQWLLLQCSWEYLPSAAAAALWGTCSAWLLHVRTGQPGLLLLLLRCGAAVAAAEPLLPLALTVCVSSWQPAPPALLLLHLALPLQQP
jgi:hypothetical protein